MKKLILVRHGRTKCNEGGKLSGLTDSILSEVGDSQVKKLTEYFRNEKIDEIYTTGFSRTKNTIKEIAKKKSIEPIVVDSFNEINFGDFEGIGFEDIKKNCPEEFKKMINEGSEYTYPGGESLKDTYYRVAKSIDEVLNEKEGKVILICAHGGTIRNILAYLICNDYNNHWNFRIDNASITEIEIEDGFAILNKLNLCI